MTYTKHLLSTLACLCLGTVLQSCADTFGNDYESTTDLIEFAPSLFCDTDSVASRSADGLEFVDAVVLQAVEGSDSLFLEIYAENTPVETEPASRGTQSSALVDIALFGYQYKASEGWNSNVTPNIACNDKLTKTSNGYVYARDYYWPGSKYKVRFFGMMPYGVGTPSGPDHKGAPTWEYTVPTEFSKQVDIKVGKSTEYSGGYRKNVPFQFNHALASINFVTDKTALFYNSGSFYPGTVKTLTISNVYGTGVYNFETGAWTNQSEKASYSLDINASYSGSTEKNIIKNTADYFFVMPQTAPADAEIVMTYTDTETKTDRVFRASIAGLKWEAGKSYTYKISTSSIKIDYTIEAEVVDNRTLPRLGGQITLNVRSYKTVSREGDPTKYVFMDWTTNTEETYNDNPYGKAQNITYVTKTNKSNPTDNQQVIVNIPRLTHEKAIKTYHRDAQQRGPDATLPYDLSSGQIISTYGPTPDIGNTANCYVVEYSGWMCFPVVFGPTFKNGSHRNYQYYDNKGNCSHDFTSFNKGYESGLEPCYTGINNHLHPTAAIPMKERDGWNMDPQTWLYDTKEHMEEYNQYNDWTIKDYLGDYDVYKWENLTAKLEWEDREGLITGVQLIKEGQYICFKADNAYGNGVISLYDEYGSRVWSWHLWCTDQISADTDVRVTNGDIDMNMAAVDLGWVPEDEYSYHTSRFRIQLTQKESNKKSEYVYVDQSTDELFFRGHSPTWQFGRMTPLSPMVDNFSGTVSDYIMQRLYDDLTKYGTDYYMPARQSYINIWDWNNTGTDYTSTPVEKSLYDPCPVGYCMPPGSIFTVFGFRNSSDEQSYAGGENPNVKADPRFENSFELYTTPQKTKTTTFIETNCYEGDNGIASHALFYLTSQGFVTFNEAYYGPATFSTYYGDDGKPYLATSSPKNIAGKIRPVREQ